MTKFDVVTARAEARTKKGFTHQMSRLHVRIDRNGIMELTDILFSTPLHEGWQLLLTDWNLAMLAVLRGKKFQEAYEYYQRKAGIIK